MFAKFELGVLSAVGRSPTGCEVVSFYSLEFVIRLLPLYLSRWVFVAALNPSSNK